MFYFCFVDGRSRIHLLSVELWVCFCHVEEINNDSKRLFPGIPPCIRVVESESGNHGTKQLQVNEIVQRKAVDRIGSSWSAKSNIIDSQPEVGSLCDA